MTKVHLEHAEDVPSLTAAVPRQATWPELLVYGVAAGMAAAGAAHVIGGAAESVVGRRTNAGAFLQVFGVLAAIYLAGSFGDRVVAVCRRRATSLLRRPSGRCP